MVFVISPGVTFGVHVSMEQKSVTVAASCRLPSESSLEVSILVGRVLRQRSLLYLNNLPWVQPDPREPQRSREVLASQRAAQERKSFRIAGLSVASMANLVTVQFDQVVPGMFVCCDASSPLLRASMDVVESPNSELRACIYAE